MPPVASRCLPSPLLPSHSLLSFTNLLALITSVEAKCSHEQQAAATATGPSDPIVVELLKLRRSLSPPPPATQPHHAKLVNQYSAELKTTLEKIVAQEWTIDLETESRLLLLIAKVPTPEFPPKDVYPANTLSKVLIDNYSLLTELGQLFTPGTMRLGGQVTRFLVRLVYSLHCWEIYHLILILPEFDHFLTMLGFDVVTSSFGPVVRPPENYLVDRMQEGVQYPYPYPFYNYLYHRPNGAEVRAEKYARISIDPYVDLTVVDPPKRELDEETATPAPVPAPRRPGRPRKRPLVEPTPAPAAPEAGAPKRKKRGRKSKAELEQLAREAAAAREAAGEEPPPVATPTPTRTLSRLRASAPVLYAPATTPPPVTSLANTTPPPAAPASDEPSDSEDEKPEEGEISEEVARKKGGVLHQCHLTNPLTGQPCNKIFYGKNELLRHEEFVHATKKKIYKCIYCSLNGNRIQSYPRHDSLARHIRRKHGVTGKENKMAVEYAKENVEIIDPSLLAAPLGAQPLPHPQYMNADFTLKPSYAGFSSFSSKVRQPKEIVLPATNDAPQQSPPQGSPTQLTMVMSPTSFQALPPSHTKNRIVEIIELPPVKNENKGSPPAPTRPVLPALLLPQLPTFMPVYTKPGSPSGPQATPQLQQFVTMTPYQMAPQYQMIPGRPGVAMMPPQHMQHFMMLPPLQQLHFMGQQQQPQQPQQLPPQQHQQSPRERPQ